MVMPSLPPSVKVGRVLGSLNRLYPSGMRERAMRALADEMTRRMASGIHCA